MRETILAVLALSIVTTMSLGIMSASVKNQIQQIDREMEVYASAVAMNVMDYVSSRSFDERTTPNEWRSQVSEPDSSEFSFIGDFGTVPACNLFEPYNDTVVCDDIDDVHMADTAWQPYPYVVDTLGTIPFEVNTRVMYADASSPDVVLRPTARTNTKKVVVSVRSVQHHLEGRHGGSVTVERLITYDKDVAEARENASVPVCTSGGETVYIDETQVSIYESLGSIPGTC